MENTLPCKVFGVKIFDIINFKLIIITCNKFNSSTIFNANFSLENNCTLT